MARLSSRLPGALPASLARWGGWYKWFIGIQATQVPGRQWGRAYLPVLCASAFVGSLVVLAIDCCAVLCCASPSPKGFCWHTL